MQSAKFVGKSGILTTKKLFWEQAVATVYLVCNVPFLNSLALKKSHRFLKVLVSLLPQLCRSLKTTSRSKVLSPQLGNDKTESRRRNGTEPAKRFFQLRVYSVGQVRLEQYNDRYTLRLTIRHPLTLFSLCSHKILSFFKFSIKWRLVITISNSNEWKLHSCPRL